MRQFLCFLCFVFIDVLHVHTQVLYECNFDDDRMLHHCFTYPISVVSNIGTADFLVPDAPLSDVTSSLKPTKNGELCQLPYRIEDYDWNMYFCNDDHCPTSSNPKSRCQDGKFGTVQLFDTSEKFYQLSTPTDSINGTGQQCLVYYYYMSSAGEKNITVIKDEKDTHEEIIDLVTDSPFNGWIQRRISFIVRASTYKIYFLVQKISDSGSPHIGFDEISIHQGSCDDEPVTSMSIRTDTIAQSTTISSEVTTQKEIISITTDQLNLSGQTEDSTVKITTASLSSIETSTTRSSSPSMTTTTTIVISYTTSTPSIATVSIESTSTTTTTTTDKSNLTTDYSSANSQQTATSSTEEISTTTAVQNIIISLYNRILPYETNSIIILAVVIPLVWIAFIVSIIWIKRSGRGFNGTSKLSRDGQLSDTIELNNVSCT